MSRSPRAAWALGLGLSVLSLLPAAPAPASTHDDDPKILDRRPPYRGRGYRSGWAAGGAASLQSIASSAPFDASGVQLVAWLPLNEFGPSINEANDCWGYVSESGREYALVGLSHGTGVVDLTDPSDPVVLTVVPGPVSTWRDIKTYRRFAYAVSEGGSGVQVIDLSQVDAGVVDYLGDVTDGGSTTATHNVAIDTESGFLYRCGGGSNGLRIYDLVNPSQPVFVGSWPDKYVHDAQVVTYDSGPFAGRQVAFCCTGFNSGATNPGLTILDVTDKANIFTLSTVAYPNPAYSHQAWLSPDRSYLYLNDELDEDLSLIHI